MITDTEDGHLQSSWILFFQGNTWHTSLIHGLASPLGELSTIHLYDSPFPMLVIYSNEP